MPTHSTLAYCTMCLEAGLTEEHKAARSQPWQRLCKQIMHFSVTHVHKETIREYQVITANSNNTYIVVNDLQVQSASCNRTLTNYRNGLWLSGLLMVYSNGSMISTWE